MVSAIEIYNKPDFRYREETFSILAINGWELLLKAKWLNEHDNKLPSLYERYNPKNNDGSKSKRTKIKRNRLENPLTIGVGFIAEKLVEKKLVTQNVWTNIQALLVVRDNAIHFYNPSRAVANSLHIVGAATVQNFASLVNEWFDNDMSKFNFHLMPLSFVTPPTQTQAVVFNAAEKNFLEYLDRLVQGADEKDSQFAVTINFPLKLNRSNDTDAIPVRRSSDPDAMLIQMTEEQAFQNFPWDYKKLTSKCRARYSEFKRNSKYHAILKSLQQDESNGLCKIRYLDPGNEKSSKTIRYQPDILREFDKHYTKATR